jgi:predicted ATPase/DNA-binding CsgD family transcriptional regulator
MATSNTPDQQSRASGRIVPAGFSARLPSPPTSFLGRAQEIGELLALLERPDTRLLTLTGPGGVGKTRLAIALGREIEVQTRTTVAFLPLASVRDPSLIAASIGAVFALGDNDDQTLPQQVSGILRDGPFLLILDNFEHVTEAAPITRFMLDACPSLRILTTSRRPLHVSGEIEYVVPPLAAPGPDASQETVQASAAWRLFVERSSGRIAESGGTSRQTDSAAIGEICRRLEGLPLAIELAAARTRVLQPPELLARLDQRFALLTGGPVDAPARHRSMREAIAWSYDLLSDGEQRLLRCLSVFSGGFTLDAVEAVAPDHLSTPVLDLLSRLIDDNLVRRMETTAGPARFTMPETIREFALDALQAYGEEASARTRHLSWLVACIGSPAPEHWSHLRGSTAIALPDELDNLRSALSWALEQQDASRAAQIAWGLLPYWWHDGLNVEGRKSLQDICDQADGLEPFVLAYIHCRIAEFAHAYGDDVYCLTAASTALTLSRELGQPTAIHDAVYRMGLCSRLYNPPASVAWMSQAADMSRAGGDDRRLALDLLGRAFAHIARGEAQPALADTGEALSLFERYEGEIGLRDNHTLALTVMAWAYGLLGLIDEADGFASRALALSREFNLLEGLRTSRRVLAEIALKRGDHQLAAAHLKEWLTIFHQRGVKSFGTFAFADMAMLAQATGNWRYTARLAGFADAFWTRSHFPESAWTNAAWTYDPAPSRHALGEAEFAAQFEAGRRLTDAEAFAEASSLIAAVLASDGRGTVLTRRELEVLAHLSEGKTNQEIADALFLSKSTVDTHVSHILSKLDVDSRRAAVGMARERGII